MPIAILECSTPDMAMNIIMETFNSVKNLVSLSISLPISSHNHFCWSTVIGKCTPFLTDSQNFVQAAANISLNMI